MFKLQSKVSLFLNHSKSSLISLNTPLRWFTSNFSKNNRYTSGSERLENKAKNVGSSAEQIQNYEKHILNRKREGTDLNLGNELEGLFDTIESTNAQYLVNINNAEQSSPKVTELSYNDYLQESDKIFNLLKNAFQEIVKQDNKVTLEVDNRYNLNIKIEVKKLGTYVIAKELESKLISVTSPLSGLFKYKYDTLSGYWRSVKDNHILDELLIREFCQHSKGLLIINH